jgi:hypothetical protein
MGMVKLSSRMKEKIYFNFFYFKNEHLIVWSEQAEPLRVVGQFLLDNDCIMSLASTNGCPNSWLARDMGKYGPNFMVLAYKNHAMQKMRGAQPTKQLVFVSLNTDQRTRGRHR